MLTKPWLSYPKQETKQTWSTGASHVQHVDGAGCHHFRRSLQWVLQWFIELNGFKSFKHTCYYIKSNTYINKLNIIGCFACWSSHVISMGQISQWSVGCVTWFSQFWKRSCLGQCHDLNFNILDRFRCLAVRLLHSMVCQTLALLKFNQLQ